MKTLGLRDIIGPVMVGPSSSHTAGALAIASMARRLCAAPPARVTFTLYGSFAHTGAGHGTDKALVAGMLGMETDDMDIRRSFELARKAGLAVRVEHDTETQTDHPNTVDVEIEDENGARLSVRGVSIGGGAAVIKRIHGVDVNITGEHTSVVIRQLDEPGVLAHIASCLADGAVNIATTRMYRTRRGSTAYTVMETDDVVTDAVKREIEQHPAVADVRIIPAASAASGAHGAESTGTICGNADKTGAESAEEAFARCDFASGEELLELCEREGVSLAGAFRLRENARCALDGAAADADEYLNRVLLVMRASAVEPLDAPKRSMGGLIGGEAQALAGSTENGAASLLDPLAAAAAAYAMAVLETNACMGRIVAAPTAGSAGVVPGVVLALGALRGFSDEKLRESLLAAAAVGYLIARNATVSGAEGGCQAEVGSAAAMAAAAAVELAGGTPDQALAAASNALTCLMGLVCDPIGGLVEIPCQKRNAAAATMALTCAQIALSGTKNLVGFDETVAAMDAVGRTLPFELRESALGGIAATPSACAWCQGCR